MRKTKIVCTLGPASDDPEVLRALLRNGTNVIRLNFSHGDHEEHGKRIAMVKQIREEMGLPVAILMDTKGPEIRIGEFKNGKVTLVEGQEFVLTTKEIEGDENRVTVHFKEITKDVNVGTTILIDDGLVALIVESIVQDEVHCRVINGGILGSRKGVNIPGVSTSLPAITTKDAEDIKFGISQDIDYIAASFIRRASDVLAIKELLSEHQGNRIKVIAKLKTRRV